ncbi:MAG TPA: metal ABC transporter substrate-binding protein [Clostridiales bacterium]|nr:metal ABC transporter substrate-binding protein [Clostridiales bacterium]
MKKTFAILLALTLSLSILGGCGAAPAGTPSPTETPDAEDKTITVGASVTPHAEILAVAAELLEDQGYTLNIVEFNDYVLPNTATESGELDANFFQHQPYLTNFNDENGTHLVSVAAIHYEPFGIYAGKTTDLSQLADGATIAIPNDGTNEARALLLLEAQGLITLADDASFTATKLDIQDNPKNLVIEELEAAQLVRALPDVDLAVINGNYAIGGGLRVSEALAVEDASGVSAQTYGNILVVKEGNENLPKIQALAAALQSDQVREFIESTYDGAVVPLF